MLRYAKGRPLPLWLKSGRVQTGLVIILILAVCAIFAPYLAPNDPNEQNLLSILTPPIWADGGDAMFPLGTDSLGRCVLSRLIFGARVALTVAFSASIGAMIIGAFFAHVAGYFGGWVDWLIGRVVEIWLSFPPVILSLILMVGLGTGLRNVVLAIVLVDWTRFCRVLRSEVIVLRRRDYVSAAQARRLLALAHHHPRNPARHPAAADHPDEPRNGRRHHRRSDPFFRRHERRLRNRRLGPDDRRCASEYLRRAVQPDRPDLRDLFAVFGFNILGDGLRRTLDTRLTQTERT